VGVDEDLKRVGAAIRARRRERQLSQEALAELTNSHRNYVGQIERGERNPSTTMVIAIARALGVNAGAFFEKVK